MSKPLTLSICQIALSSIDLERAEIWWRKGLGFLPSADSRMFTRGKGLSTVAQLENAAAATRWLIGQNEWLQIEMWQYETPLPRLMHQNSAPNHVGFSRCGVWVQDFDATLQRLSDLGSHPLSNPVGDTGERRVCVRDPDGIFVELLESDPLADSASPAKYPANAAFRSITITTENLGSSTNFAREGLGLSPLDTQLHSDEHESLWQLEGASCERECFVSGDMILEYVHYKVPRTRGRHPHSRINDQGILNIALGGNSNQKAIEAQELQANRAGAASIDRLISPIAGCVYMTDPQGFSFEFVWGSPVIGSRILGFYPNNKPSYPLAANRRVEHSVYIKADSETIFKALLDTDTMPRWSDKVTIKAIPSTASSTNIVSSERLLEGGSYRLREQITGVDDNRGYQYRATGKPFAVYLGELNLTPDNNGVRVSWIVRFRAKNRVLGLPLQYLVGKQIRTALNGFKERFEHEASSAVS